MEISYFYFCLNDISYHKYDTSMFVLPEFQCSKNLFAFYKYHLAYLDAHLHYDLH